MCTWFPHVFFCMISGTYWYMEHRWTYDLLNVYLMFVQSFFDYLTSYLNISEHYPFPDFQTQELLLKTISVMPRFFVPLDTLINNFTHLLVYLVNGGTLPNGVDGYGEFSCQALFQRYIPGLVTQKFFDFYTMGFWHISFVRHTPKKSAAVCLWFFGGFAKDIWKKKKQDQWVDWLSWLGATCGENARIFFDWFLPHQ